MDRKRKTKDPCPKCLMHSLRCICSQIPQLSLKTRLTLIIHHKEMKRTTNTGQLAVHALKNSTMHIRGLQNSPMGSVLAEGYEPLILYPSDTATDIASLKFEKPVQLIVSDGNWRQASKAFYRLPELKDVRHIKVRAPQIKNPLRKEHFENGLSTLEAIAHALGAIEGDAIKKILLDLFEAKLRATQEGRAGLIAQLRFTTEAHHVD